MERIACADEGKRVRDMKGEVRRVSTGKGLDALRAHTSLLSERRCVVVVVDMQDATARDTSRSNRILTEQAHKLA